MVSSNQGRSKAMQVLYTNTGGKMDDWVRILLICLIFCIILFLIVFLFRMHSSPTFDMVMSHSYSWGVE